MARHDHLIDQLFKDEGDRALARDFAAKFEGEPLMSDRIEPLLREAARTAQRADGGELTPEQARDYLGSFAREALGAPEHLVTSAMSWLNSGGPDPSATPEMPAGMSPEMKRLIAEAGREAAQKDVAKFEQMMRENPSEYWRPENQRAYLQALERSIAVPDTPAPATSAGEAPAALPATAPPAAQPAPALARIIQPIDHFSRQPVGLG